MKKVRESLDQARLRAKKFRQATTASGVIDWFWGTISCLAEQPKKKFNTKHEGAANVSGQTSFFLKPQIALG